MVGWLREREIITTMMNMYIIYSWRDHLQEAKDGIGDRVGWLGVRWDVTLHLISIVKCFCAGYIKRRGVLPRSFKRDRTH